jgi:hypothetical protein
MKPRYSVGVIPAHLRFQVGLPFPASTLNGFKADISQVVSAAPYSGPTLLTLA